MAALINRTTYLKVYENLSCYSCQHDWPMLNNFFKGQQNPCQNKPWFYSGSDQFWGCRQLFHNSILVRNWIQYRTEVLKLSIHLLPNASFPEHYNSLSTQGWNASSPCDMLLCFKITMCILHPTVQSAQPIHCTLSEHPSLDALPLIGLLSFGCLDSTIIGIAQDY